LFYKSIIIDANPLIICLFSDMTLFAKASYTIITPKQIVLVCKRLSLRDEKMLSSISKQIVYNPWKEAFSEKKLKAS